MEIGGAEATLSAGESRLAPLESRLKPRLGPAAEAAVRRQFSDRAEPRVHSRLSSGPDPSPRMEEGVGGYDRVNPNPN